MSQDLVLSSSRSSALTPLNLGLSAVLGPSIATGPSLLADVCARLLWMLFERILRGVEGLARSYLEKFAETRAKMGEEKARVLDEVKAEQDAAQQSKVTEAIQGRWLYCSLWVMLIGHGRPSLKVRTSFFWTSKLSNVTWSSLGTTILCQALATAQRSVERVAVVMVKRVLGINFVLIYHTVSPRHDGSLAVRHE